MIFYSFCIFFKVSLSNLIIYSYSLYHYNVKTRCYDQTAFGETGRLERIISDGGQKNIARRVLFTKKINLLIKFLIQKNILFDFT